MPRIGRVRQFEKELQEMAGGTKGDLTTAKGLFGYESTSKMAKDLQSILKPSIAVPFEQPTRNDAEAFLVQEMVAVCSRLERALRKLSGDATQDFSGAAQPFCIRVDESNTTLREKIFLEAQRIVTETKLGLKGPMRMYRMLLSGDAIGQPIYTKRADESQFRLTDVWLMPTWEMHYDRRTGIWKQIKLGSRGREVIAVWDKVRDFMVRSSHNADDNRLYGRSALLALIVNYRQYIAALEDLYVACRTRAPRRLVHYLGSEDGTWSIDRKTLLAYKRRNELGTTKTIYTDYYANKGFEEIKQIPGDAAGVKSIMSVVHMKESVMLEDLGLPVSMQDLAGRHVSESVDAAYASTINTLRGEDNIFVTDVVKKGLALAGYRDVDIDLAIPPLGETATLRWQRVWKAYENHEIDYFTACALIGEKNPFTMRKRIEEDLAWFEKNPEAWRAIGQKDPDSDGTGTAVNGSESTAKGADGKSGEARRAKSRNSGKPVATGA